jgi:uncharacterized protein (DUF1499 family)
VLEGRKVAKWLAYVTLALLILTALALAVAGPGHRTGLLDLGVAFSALAVAAFAAVLMVMTGAAGIWFALRRGVRGVTAICVIGCLAGLALTANNLAWFMRMANAPAIHDISTDVRNPPDFVALAEVRVAAPNRADYPGIETAEAQLTWYPDIQTLRFQQSFADVFAAAEASALAMDWHVVFAEQQDGRVEATAVTPFFGFRDDIVIRVRQREGATLVDVRSASRVGRSDLGTNARRIRAYAEDLERRLR